MALSDPMVAYIAASNLEAHQIVNMLADAGIEGAVVEDVSPVSVWIGGLASQLHRPEVWIERADTERATPILKDYEQRLADRVAARDTGELIEATCENCGRSSNFPATQRGTVQNCPYCRGFVDVGEDVGMEGWEEAEGEDGE